MNLLAFRQDCPTSPPNAGSSWLNATSAIAVIETPEALASLISRIEPGALCAIDTEADSLHRFRESLCLIQFAHGEDSVLIDPLAIDDLMPLSKALESATVWMHGADYDMTMLRREFGVLPAEVFDTQIGARLLGLRKFGLANLVSHYFGVELVKTSQKADWGRRPLSPKMTDYALNDVRYLLPMAEMIVAGLREKGRYAWFLESCEAAKAKVLARDESKDEPWRVQGAGRLDRRGLSFLLALWEWRNDEAESWDRPTFMVVPNRVLVEWSALLSAGKPVEVPKSYRAERRKRLDKVLAETRKMPESEYPEKIKGSRRRRDPDFDRKVSEIIAVRDRKGEELGIDSSLIASRSMIEVLAAGDEVAEGLLLNWQMECLGIS